jgi:methionine-rich copper-binding protein CopC
VKKIARAYNFRMASVRNLALASLIVSTLCVFAQQPQPHNSVSIAPAKLPQASLWNHYLFRFQADGGISPYHWHILNGLLPRGLTLQEDGQVIGTVEDQGQQDFTVAVIDHTGKTRKQNYTLSIETPLSTAWSRKTEVNGQRIDGSIKVSNTTGRDFDLTFVVLAVNDIGRATAIGYQRFSLKASTRDLEVPFGDTLPAGNYSVNVDVVGEEPQSNMIFRSRLVTGKEAVTQGP